jgi:hypothetical protein
MWARQRSARAIGESQHGGELPDEGIEVLLDRVGAHDSGPLGDEMFDRLLNLLGRRREDQRPASFRDCLLRDLVAMDGGGMGH